MLERYRKKLPSFNDDIQGTGAVSLAGLVVACASQGRRLRDEKVIVYGAGAGGIGVAWAIREGMKREGATDDEAREKVLVLDSKGLLIEGRAMEDYKKPYAQKGITEAWSLEDAVVKGKATVLLGLSGQAGTFTKSIIAKMLPNAERADRVRALESHEQLRGAARRHPGVDERQSVRRDGKPVRARERGADRSGEQRVHLPRSRLRRDPRGRFGDHEQHGARGGVCPRRHHEKRTTPACSIRLSQSSAP